MNGNEFEFIARLRARTRPARTVQKAMWTALREVRRFFEKPDVCLAIKKPGLETRVRAALPQTARVDEALVTRFLDGERPRVPHDMLLVRIHRRERPWAALVMQRPERPFDIEELAAARRIADTLSELVQHIDRTRVSDVHARVQQRMMEQLRPEDLFYQVLHGLHELTHYDHAGSLWIFDPGRQELRLVAEKIAYRKGPSRRIHAVRSVGDAARALMEGDEVYGFDRRDGAWSAWRGSGAEPLLALMDDDAEEAQPAAALCAPLSTRHGVLGVLRLTALHAGSLGPYEADLVRRFLPPTSVAIQNRRQAQFLEGQVLEARTKVVLADVTRDISHDINNAVGTVLPLVQQMREDIQQGSLDDEVLAADLEEVEHAMKLCRDIAGGMLVKELGERGDLGRSVDYVGKTLGGAMRRNGVRLDVDLDESLPLVRAPQGDLNSLVLNLAHNAVRAMSHRPQGEQNGRTPGTPAGSTNHGVLHLEARVEREGIRFRVEDNGRGIAPDDLKRIVQAWQNPEFREPVVDRPEGQGMGLRNCLGIVRALGGQVDLFSTLGQGTRVEILLPVQREGVA